MTAMRGLLAAMAEADRRGQRRPHKVVVAPKTYEALVAELCGTYMRLAPGKTLVFGAEIVLEMPGEFCKSCGAPIEPNVCSYCRQPSAIIGFEVVK